MEESCNTCIHYSSNPYNDVCVACVASCRASKYVRSDHVNHIELGYITHKSQPTKITNLEYIKTCSKEKLARFLCDEFGLDCGDCIAKEYCYSGHNGFIDWLSIEREEDGY